MVSRLLSLWLLNSSRLGGAILEAEKGSENTGAVGAGNNMVGLAAAVGGDMGRMDSGRLDTALEGTSGESSDWGLEVASELSSKLDTAEETSGESSGIFTSTDWGLEISSE